MNKKKKIVIVGGVAAGASAATRARRLDPNAEIKIIERGPVVSFANCGLPYHLGGEIAERSKLIVASKGLFEKRFGIDVLLETSVVSISRESKTLNLNIKNHPGEQVIAYDKLILATGSKLITLPNLSTDLSNVFSLWTLDNLDEIIKYLNQEQVKRVGVVGAGFIGLEVVEQLVHRGYELSLIEKAPQVLGPLDSEMASFIEDELLRNKVKLFLGTSIQSVLPIDNKIKSVKLESGELLEVDALIVGIGVRPEVQLAKDAGLEIGKFGGVQVNNFQQTSDPDIYAAGDMTEYLFAPTGLKQLNPLAGPANRAGRIAGEHAATGNSQFSQKVFATAIVRVFSKVAGMTGLSEKACIRNSIEYRVSYVTAGHHAGYFPGAKDLVIKLLYAPDSGKILGAQVVGEEGVDKRVDIVSTCMHFEGTIKDLATLDLAYAPPFGSAKDPIHMAAFTALNDLDNYPRLISPSTDLSNIQVVDVRTEKELKILPLSNAIHIPIDAEVDIRSRLSNLDLNKSTVVVCHSGKRAHVVASMMIGLGFREVFNLGGGMSMRVRMLRNKNLLS